MLPFSEPAAYLNQQLPASISVLLSDLCIMLQAYYFADLTTIFTILFINSKRH